MAKKPRHEDTWEKNIKDVFPLAEQALKDEGVTAALLEQGGSIATGQAKETARLWFEEEMDSFASSFPSADTLRGSVDRLPLFILPRFFVNQLDETAHLPLGDSGRTFILRMAHSGLTLLAHKKFKKAQVCGGKILRFLHEEEIEDERAQLEGDASTGRKVREAISKGGKESGRETSRKASERTAEIRVEYDRLLETIHPRDISNRLAKKFKLTPQTIRKHLKKK